MNLPPPVGLVCRVSVFEQPYREFEVCGYHKDNVWLFGYGVGHIVEKISSCKFSAPSSGKGMS